MMYGGQPYDLVRSDTQRTAVPRIRNAGVVSSSLTGGTSSFLQLASAHRAPIAYIKLKLRAMAKVKKLAGTAGWGVVGLVALGPLGAIGGMLLGGNKKEVSFTAELDDGRRFMAVTDSKTWRKSAAAVFERDGSDHDLKGP